MQTTGPDESIDANTRVKMLRREMGFSLVQLPRGSTGYIANENLAVAPPLPPQPQVTTVPDMSAPSSSRGSRRGGGGDSPRYSGEQINDTPLPNAPSVDLNIAPEEVPASTPAPTPSQEKPKFRF